MTHGAGRLGRNVDLEAIEGADLASAEPAVRQYLAARVRDPSLVDDLTQETLLRVFEVRDRLERSAIVPYAVTVAKHLVVARARSNAIAERHLQRLVTDPVSPPPDDLVLRHEDEVALRTALEALPEDDRAVLLAHVVDGTDTATLAAGRGATAGGVAARLSRARARARVDYVVASNRAVLPSSQCRPVLLSLSSADRRRQVATRAVEHLAGCSVCADLGPQLLERRRSIISLLPIPFLPRLLGAARALVRGHPAASVGGALGTLAAAAVVAASVSPHHEAATPTTRVTRSAPSAVTTTRPRPRADLAVPTLLAMSPVRWRGLAGRRAVANGVPILSVPADEGFWIGFDDEHRIWVELTGGGESAVHVVAGRRASFRGQLSVHGAGFAVQEGVTAEAGGLQLRTMGAHLTVNASKVIVSN